MTKTFRQFLEEKKKKKQEYEPQKCEWGTRDSVEYAKSMTPGEKSNK